MPITQSKMAQIVNEALSAHGALLALKQDLALVLDNSALTARAKCALVATTLEHFPVPSCASAQSEHEHIERTRHANVLKALRQRRRKQEETEHGN